MDSLFHTYNNVLLCMKEYRNYTTKDKVLTLDEFKSTVTNLSYLLLNYIKPIEQKQVFIYLFDINNTYLTNTGYFRKLLSKIESNICDVIIISKYPLSVYINKIVNKLPNIGFYSYLYSNFITEKKDGPLCSKHTILSKEEMKTLCNRDLMVHPLSMPAILISDPQNIWIGGSLGQIIKIESKALTSGDAIRYRIVVPDSGKINDNEEEKEETVIEDEVDQSIEL